MRKNILDITSRKGPSSDPLTCLTVYTAPMARAADSCCDLLIVGDNVATVLYGEATTLQADMDMMIRHGRAVARASVKAMVVVAMPFGSFQEGREQALRNAVIILRETGAAAVKIEGGLNIADTIRHLSSCGIPVMGHIGLLPQSIHATGGLRIQGRDDDSARKIFADAKAISEAGAFAMVCEGVPEQLAGDIAQAVSCPVIGMCASAKCDGQILNAHDVTGLSRSPRPKFVKSYAELSDSVTKAIENFAKDVRSRAFPAEEHVFSPVRISQTPGIQPAVIQQTDQNRIQMAAASTPSIPATTVPTDPASKAQPASPAPASLPMPANIIREKEAHLASTQKLVPPTSSFGAKPAPANVPHQGKPENDKDGKTSRPFFDTVLRATRRS